MKTLRQFSHSLSLRRRWKQNIHKNVQRQKTQKLKIFNHQKDNTDTCPLPFHATWLLQSEPTRPTRQGWYRRGSTWPLCGAEHTCSTPSWEACSPWKSGSPGYLKTCRHLSWYSVSELLTPHNETSRHDQDVQLRVEPRKQRHYQSHQGEGQTRRVRSQAYQVEKQVPHHEGVADSSSGETITSCLTYTLEVPTSWRKERRNQFYSSFWDQWRRWHRVCQQVHLLL